MSSQEDLITNAVAGDNVALQSLLFMHYSDIETTVRQNLGADLAAKVEVQDLMQEVLLAAYQEIGHFAPSDAGSFRAWLKRIATNRVVDAARKFGRAKRGGQAAHIAIHRSATESLDEIWEWVFSESNPPDRPARRREAHEALQVCLARLENGQREAVVAHYFEAKDVQQVAKRMDRSPGAVRELLRRARANLAKDLDTASKWLSSR
jgi:RNA polymerase sigma-70 factor (ECF subfamily)